MHVLAPESPAPEWFVGSDSSRACVTLCPGAVLAQFTTTAGRTRAWLHALGAGVQLPITGMQPSFSDVYLDVREFGISDWNRHRDLAAAIVSAHKEQIFTQSSHQTVTQSVSDFLREWTRLRQSP